MNDRKQYDKPWLSVVAFEYGENLMNISATDVEEIETYGEDGVPFF